MLLRDIPDERLEEMYGEEDYYWYLKSNEFKETFLRRIASHIHCIILRKKAHSISYHQRLRVLDVGCGEGWLADVLDFDLVDYVGIEGSLKALEKATIRYPASLFVQTRIEETTKHLLGSFDLIVFGGILDVLVKPERYLDFVAMYLQAYSPKHFIVYDLQRFNPFCLDNNYELLEAFEGEATVAGKKLPTIKTKRQIRLYECRR